MIAAKLRRQLVFAPPEMDAVINHFDGMQNLAGFALLLKEYLPEHREALLKLPPGDAFKRFDKLFGDRYFPINSYSYLSYGGNNYQHTARQIPVGTGARKTYGYENHKRGAHLLAAVISRCDTDDRSMQARRIAMLDSFGKLAGSAGKLLNEGGWELWEIEQALAGSPYPEMLDWCRWLFGVTGNPWLDESVFNWSRENVARLKETRKPFLKTWAAMKQFDTWLKTDFALRSFQIVKYIRERLDGNLMKILVKESSNEKDTANS